MRFQDKIIIENNIPESFNEHLIIPLSLQMLIENAVKHNIVSAKKPLYIQLKIADNCLIVSNNKQIKSQVHNSTKVGLENIKSRYKLVNDTEVEVIETEDAFKVKLPLIKIV
jgi:LytS/YehU family sensor histidine kinase